MNLILNVNSSAEKKSLVTVWTSGTLALVGLVTTETVVIEIPKVAFPDESNDNHWTPLVQDGTTVELSATNNCVRIPAKLLIRINKAAGVAGNAYGVSWS